MFRSWRHGNDRKAFRAITVTEVLTAEAQKNLGVSYYKGVGVQQDYMLAYYWLSLAVRGIKGKNKNIVRARDTAAKKLTPEQLEKVEQTVKEWKPKKEGKQEILSLEVGEIVITQHWWGETLFIDI